MNLASIPHFVLFCIAFGSTLRSAVAVNRDVGRHKLRELRDGIGEKFAKKHGERNLSNDSAEDNKNYRNDPCRAKLQSKKAFVVLGQPGYSFSPSFWIECAKSLKVDYINMLMHIDSLTEIFRDYHAFFDIAKDPLNSEPAEFQPEFGQSLFSGPNEGVVDFDKEMDLISRNVWQNGYASMHTFWEIQTAVTAYRDGHVAPPYTQGLFSSYDLYALPAKFLDPSGTEILVGTETVFSMDRNAKIQMSIIYELQEVESREIYFERKELAYINDHTVHDFTVMLADSKSAPLTYPSLGARTSALIALGSIFEVFKEGSSWDAVPPDAVPDSFHVRYEDGHTERFQTILRPSYVFPFVLEPQTNNTFVTLKREEAETFINLPGDQYDAYVRSLGELPVDFGEPARKLLGKSAKTELPLEGLVQKQSHVRDSRLRRKLNDDEEEAAEEDIPPPQRAGFVDGNTTLFYKLPSFGNVDEDMFLGLWTKILQDANAEGITNLIIDYSQNGGGLVSTSYATIMSFFPEVGLEWLTDQWDINYNNAMKEWLDVGVPLMTTIEDGYDSLTEEDKLIRINSISARDIENYRIAIGGMVELCNDASSFFGDLGNEAYCRNYDALLVSFEALVKSLDVDSYDLFMQNLRVLALRTNPWTVNFKLQPELATMLQEKEPVTQTRGGVQSNTTVKFDLLGSSSMKSLYDKVQNATKAGGGNPFEQYVFLSSGDSASSAAISPFISSQLANNGLRTGTTRSVKLVSHGGTGNADDMIFSSVPASVLDVRICEPIIGDALLQMLVDALPEAMTNLDAIVAETKEYSKTVAVPPFFAASLPKVPTRSFYDINMEPGAAPLQFVKIPLDGYIPKIYNNVTLENDGELQDLYTEALAFFD